MKARRLYLWLSLSVLALAAGAAPPAGPQPPEVEVAQPVAGEVVDYEEALGVVEPSVTIQVKARVSGCLDKVLFKDGAEVKKGDVLFEIDPKPFKVELERAEADVALAEAVLARADADFKRARACSTARPSARTTWTGPRLHARRPTLDSVPLKPPGLPPCSTWTSRR